MAAFSVDHDLGNTGGGDIFRGGVEQAVADDEVGFCSDNGLRRGVGRVNGDSTAYAMAAVALSIGAILGALLAGGKSVNRWTMIGGAGAYGGLQISLGVTASFTVFLCLLVAAGGSFTLFSVAATSIIQSRAPEGLRGRVMSLFFIASQAPTRMGAVLVAVLVEIGGTATSLVVAGLVTVLSVTAISVWSARRIAQAGPDRVFKAPAGTSSTPEARSLPTDTAGSQRPSVDEM